MDADRTIVITGPVGSGKSTIAAALSDVLDAFGVPHGMIDVDYVRWASPTPEDDRFNTRLGMRNVQAVAANYREVGARVVILADVVENMAQRADYEAAIPGAHLTIVRLRVPMEIVAVRLRERESAASLDWYLQRAPELEAIMDAGGIGDLVIDVGSRTPEEVAREIAAVLQLRGEEDDRIR